MEGRKIVHNETFLIPFFYFYRENMLNNGSIWKRRPLALLQSYSESARKFKITMSKIIKDQGGNPTQQDVIELGSVLNTAYALPPLDHEVLLQCKYCNLYCPVNTSVKSNNYRDQICFICADISVFEHRGK